MLRIILLNTSSEVHVWIDKWGKWDEQRNVQFNLFIKQVVNFIYYKRVDVNCSVIEETFTKYACPSSQMVIYSNFGFKIVYKLVYMLQMILKVYNV